MADIALIQLISEQTMPNLLPVFALKPAKLVHLTTERTASHSIRIVEAAVKAGVFTQHEPIRLSPMPTIDETSQTVRRALEKCRSQGLHPVVNFTGGTKLMSIGAHTAARGEEAQSFYVDTTGHGFNDGGTAPGLREMFGGDLSFTRLAGRLNLDVIVAANGHRAISPGKDWRPLAPIARFLLEHPVDEESLHSAIHGGNGLCPNGREPRKPSEWLTLIDVPFDIPTPLRTPLADLGLIRLNSQGRAMLPDKTRTELQALDTTGHVHDFQARHFAAVAPFQETLAFLTGAWWELILAEAAYRSGRFSDLRWSAQIVQQSGSSLEEDLVCLDGVEAACISCKRGRGRQRLLTHLEEFQSRATAIGGHFTRRFLAVRQLPAGNHATAIQRRARELGITLLRPADLEQSDPFAVS